MKKFSTTFIVAILFMVSLSIPAFSQYNQEIYQLQRTLQQRGYNPGPSDGYWGNATESALRKFQQDHGLPISGILDPKTKAELGIQDQSQRFALVIGNAEYKTAPLKNPVNDAKDITSALKEVGFSVELLTNAKQRVMEESIRKLGRQLRSGGVGLFYFAGHGFQVKGRNYLLPVNARIESEADVRYESVDAGRVLAQMEDAQNGLNIIILDACRDNPFARSFRSDEKGLAKMDAPTGSYLAYSTAPGSVAADGIGRNGLYTSQLLKHIKSPGLKLEEVFKRVRIDVAKSSGNKQIPWDSSSLMGDFYFQPKRGVGVVKPLVESKKIASGIAVIESSPTGINATLIIGSNVSGAKVFIDGRPVGTTPLTGSLTGVEVTKGEHRILVEKQGYNTYQKTVSFKAGWTKSMYANLSKMGILKGRLYVVTDPKNARILLMNTTLKFHQGIELDPGHYLVSILAEGYETEEQLVSLNAGEDRHLDIRLTPIKKETFGISSQGTFYINKFGMKFVYIPPGSFMMGSPTSEPGRYSDEKQHHVTLTKRYAMQTTEVTQGQWRAVMGRNPLHTFHNYNCGKDCPVERVSFNGIQSFIQKLNNIEGIGKYRLPTEAEWEYAARAGSTTAFPDGGISELICGHDLNLEAIGWYCGNSNAKTHPVAQKQPNAWGLYDMHGNVSEWCQDYYGKNYPSGSVTDPTGPSSGPDRVWRGCSFNSNADQCRSANRGRARPDLRYFTLGFRLAFSPGQ